jgi:spore coat protein U-like protein
MLPSEGQQLKPINKIIASFVAATIAGTGAPAIAGTASSSLASSATVSANCTVSTTAVAFGVVDTLSATPDDATGGLNVTCTSGTAWTATAGAGTGTGATLSVRKMSSGANLLNYTLYKDSGRTSIWGDGVAPTATITGTGTGSVQANTIYGRVTASQGTAVIGSYADTVAVTITF